MRMSEAIQVKMSADRDGDDIPSFAVAVMAALAVVGILSCAALVWLSFSCG